MAIRFITGCSSGFGEEVTGAALTRAKTTLSQQTQRMQHLEELGALTPTLDVSSPESEIQKVVDEAINAYDAIDILFNNAGVALQEPV
jgi:NADP-dependent 3-hydroxy acid dehydrogenase YdfG